MGPTDSHYTNANLALLSLNPSMVNLDSNFEVVGYNVVFDEVNLSLPVCRNSW